MRILHSSDWHLGHRLHDWSRDREHAAFLDWLLGRIAEEEIDALIVAGDVFDGANPPAEAQRLFFGFLDRARLAQPRLQTVVIAGNHDSPARLEAPRELLGRFGVRVVGSLRAADLDAATDDRLIVDLADASGRPGAKVVAVPFLRIGDLLPGPRAGADGEGDDLVSGVAEVYRRLIDRAREGRRSGEALIATGHLYMSGGRHSELSERKILGGNLHALPASIFPEDLSYAALGHLHLPQCVGSRNDRRYSGSPIPLSTTERGYRHQVLVLEFADGELREVRPHLVPRQVEILRIPEQGALPPEDLLDALRALPAAAGSAVEERPFLEVAAAIVTPEPRLRERIAEAVLDRGVRLVRIVIDRGGSGDAPADAEPRESLQDLSPDRVFRRFWSREHQGDPPPALLSLFHELVEECERSPDAAAPAEGAP